MDTVLGALGRDARAVRLENRSFAEENRLLDDAEKRRGEAERSCSDLTAKKADENTRFEAIHRELSEKMARREQEAAATGGTLQRLEEDRRAIRDRRKDIERQQRAYLKTAEDRESQSQKAQMGDTRQSLLRAAHDLRSDAARLQPEREDLERRLGEIEGPLQEATARDQTARGELEAARRALQDAREGHRHRLAELEAELSHKSRELQQADSEILRRLVTLGTLVNLHRVDRIEFKPHFERIDSLRGAIATREREIERLNAERFAFDRASLIRGIAVLAGGVVLLITMICIVIVLAS
jgi:chromosome segregation ATPase